MPSSASGIVEGTGLQDLHPAADLEHLSTLSGCFADSPRLVFVMAHLSRKVRHVLHVAYFISANHGFSHYPFSATMVK